ncbi:hypothetical protein ACVXHA_17775 [Escherichia coli]
MVVFRPEMVVCHSDREQYRWNYPAIRLVAATSRFVILRVETYMTRI